MTKSLKVKVLAVLVFAGVLGVSGTSFAGTKKIISNIILDAKAYKLITQTQTLENNHKPPMPPKEFNKKHPPLSRDIRDQHRPPEPPDKKHPPVSHDKRPPMPHSDDRRPPMPPKGK